ncbi:MAG: MlaD family protein [Pseudomonadota bacterium]
MTEAIIVTKKRWRISPIWFLPFTALLLAIWLGYETYIHRGVTVSVRFTTGSGISINKTKVMYKGINIGKVTDVEIDKNDIEQVIVTVLLDKRTEPYLLSDTQFWLVKPSVSLGGISGLDTLVSGNYIAMNPGTTGKQKVEYHALKEAPIDNSTGHAGLFIQVQAKTRGSIVANSPIYFKKIKVGEVLGSKYNKTSDNVNILIKIEQEYAYLVKKQSRFYNVSGIQISGGLGGIKVQTESLASIVIGGLAFYNPENTYLNETAENGEQYPLFEDFESADIGIPIILQLDKTDDLQEGITEIRYLGSKVGFIKKITTDYQTGTITANTYMDPLAANLLTTGSKIWRVEPVLSISRVTGIETLIKGVYLKIRPGKGAPNSVFQVLDSPPPVDISEPGLHISLTAHRLGSIQVASGVYYKNIEIGSVQSYQLNDSNKTLAIQLFIKPAYAQFINSNSHFYNNSGINIKGGLSGLSIQTESLSSIISGGISIYNPEIETEYKQNIQIAKNGDNYTLYENFEKSRADKEIAIYFSDVSGINEDSTRIIYKGIELGYVYKLLPDKKINKIKVLIKVNPNAREFLKKNTQFWLAKPSVSLAGIKGLDTLVSGNYITIKPGGGRSTDVFTALEEAPELVLPSSGLQIIIKSQELGSISVGAPVLYHQLAIGLVSSYKLDKKAENILISLRIQNKYRNLVKRHSRFYQASGFTLKGGLTGLDFRSESLTALLKGGIAFITPKINKKTVLAYSRQVFPLYPDLSTAKQNRFVISVAFPDAQGLEQGTKIKFNGLTVGEIEQLELHTDLQQVIAKISIDNKLKRLLGQKSRFMLAKAKFGLVKTENLATLIKGNYIVLEPVSGKFTKYFKAQEMKARQGLHLFLSTAQLGSIKRDNPIYYRQVKVGKVLGFQLSKTAKHVLIHILVEQQYATLVRKNSKFWNASGINLDINLFAGSKIKTGSLQSILDGGISFATPDSSDLAKKNSDENTQSPQKKSKQILAIRAQPNSVFELHPEVDEKWLEWNPEIRL